MAIYRVNISLPLFASFLVSVCLFSKYLSFFVDYRYRMFGYDTDADVN